MIFRLRPGTELPSVLKSGVALTVGAFDGVHLGHQAVISQLRAEALRLGLPSVVMTFRPDPAEFFQPQSPRISLMSWREKMLGLKATGVDAVLSLAFDQRLSEMSARQFLTDLLGDQLSVRFLLIGDDFRFGAGRVGDYELACSVGKEIGFGVDRCSTHEIGGERVSSTRIRGCLQKADLRSAKMLLGRGYEICGRVVPGQKLGRTLGFPTANIPVRRTRVGLSGVFAVRVQLPKGEMHCGVANLGTRPAVNPLDQPLLEVYILDFAGDLYGQRLRVEFLHRIRDEADFANLDDLKAAISNDVHQARNWFLQQSEIE